ncbi:MAG: hypothetical protein ACREJN_02810 [Nitrospiraceae bacterium]
MKLVVVVHYDPMPLFLTLIEPYRSFIEQLHADGRITTEEVAGIDQVVQDTRSLVQYGYEDFGEAGGPAPSTGHEQSRE